MHPTPRGGGQLRFSWGTDKHQSPISITATRAERSRKLSRWNPTSAATRALVAVFSSLVFMTVLGTTSTTIMEASLGPASPCLAQPIPITGPLLSTLRDSGDPAITPSDQPALAGPAMEAAFSTVLECEVSHDPSGQSGSTGGISASSGLACFELSPRSPGWPLRSPPPKRLLQGRVAGDPLLPVRVEQPEGLPVLAVDLPDLWSSLFCPRAEQQLRSLPRRRSRSLTSAPTHLQGLLIHPPEALTHLLEVAPHQSPTNPRMEQRLARWPGHWRLCRSQMDLKD
jgi:hypothetical protein